MKALAVEDFQNSILEQLYSIYEHKMYGIAYSILNNSGQAEDAVQDAFIKLIPHLGHISEVSSMETKRLITYTIKNIAIDKYRKNKKESAKNFLLQQVEMRIWEWLIMRLNQRRRLIKYH